MNTTCRHVTLTFGSIGGHSETAPCGEPTTHGRTHCHVHRVEKIKELSQAKVRAREAYEAAEKAFDVYFREGSGL
jgi:hypothetical protein